MELMFITLAGVLIGLAARYLLPGRSLHGSLLVPAVGAAVAAAVWVALTWAGLAWDDGWIWWITLAAAAVVSCAVALWLGSARERADERDLAAYRKTGAPTAAR